MKSEPMGPQKNLTGFFLGNLRYESIDQSPLFLNSCSISALATSFAFLTFIGLTSDLAIS